MKLKPILGRSLILVAFLCSTIAQQLPSLQSYGEWKQLEYEFPTPQDRQIALNNQQYIPGNGVPIDVDVDYKGKSIPRIFVTVPRFVGGIPVTLGILTGQSAAGGPIIRPYPNYLWHKNQGKNCGGMTSVFRVAIDECQRLWVLDTGRVGDDQLCFPKLFVFNLKTDELIRSYEFPQNQIYPRVSLFITPIVDVRDPGTCLNTMVYMADVGGFSIMVYSLKENRSWRVVNKLAYPNPDYGTFNVAGEQFDLMDGIFGMSVSPKTQRNRNLYFHSLASISENSVPLYLLDNRTIWENDSGATPRSFVSLGQRGTQSAAEAMDQNGNLYFGLMDPIAIACWDSSTPYSRENMKLIAQNDATLQFTSGLKIIVNKQGQEELWALSCRFQKIMTGSINFNEINFRILSLPLNKLLNGGKCLSARPPSSNIIFPRY